MNMNDNMGVAGFLKKHALLEPVSFHMPGHKGADLYRAEGYEDFLEESMNWDITEIPGADNLFQTEGVILHTMNRYKELYGSKATYLLVNGSSTGVIAAVMTAISPGDTVVMARNCHKSAFNGLGLAGGRPVYAYPEMIEDFGITGEVSAAEIEKKLAEAPGAKAVIVTSPNYYGVCSDIAAIAEVTHRAGAVLIVDQAHGAHLKFFDEYAAEHAEGRKLAAENLGADIVINSTHKTLATLTQTAIVNICSDRVDLYDFEDKLQLIESSSPSYVLMASLDINADILEKSGHRLITGWEENLAHFYEGAATIDGLKVLHHPLLDKSKINLDMSALGIDGLTLEEKLMEKGIFVELVTGNIVMCMSGIGNSRSDFTRLRAALRSIAEEAKKDLPFADQNDGGEFSHPDVATAVRRMPIMDIPTAKERVPIEKAAGRVCALSIIPYPPGVPLICPGEVMDADTLAYAAEIRRKGEKVMGIDDQGRVVVGKQ